MFETFKIFGDADEPLQTRHLALSGIDPFAYHNLRVALKIPMPINTMQKMEPVYRLCQQQRSKQGTDHWHVVGLYRLAGHLSYCR